MQTGIEKFKDILDYDTCETLVNILESNLDKATDKTYGCGENVICKELLIIARDVDDIVKEAVEKTAQKYHEKYPWFYTHSDAGFALRKISGATREHVDVSDRGDNRNVSIIIGLNSDFENGEFHFPYQEYTTTLKRGEAIAFPVWFMYPHSVDAPIGYRYTINTWMLY
tara:strand:+ start:87 stop:593 length:507 start_codon:yes stop_codon:yes gene_type:complete